MLSTDGLWGLPQSYAISYRPELVHLPKKDSFISLMERTVPDTFSYWHFKEYTLGYRLLKSYYCLGNFYTVTVDWVSISKMLSKILVFLISLRGESFMKADC